MAQTLDADVIVIGSGISGLVTATQLAAKKDKGGAKRRLYLLE